LTIERSTRLGTTFCVVLPVVVENRCCLRAEAEVLDSTLVGE
jgi:hypothetical protein